MTDTDYLDVIIIGAGLSGIGAACHLQRECPDRSYAILESRGAMGGTWDLFRYPGIRSDSDMHTLGYSFKPWRDGKAIADGPSILEYIHETAREHNIEEKIRYQQRVTDLAWSSTDGTWTVSVTHTESGETRQLRCNFIMMCAGYYSYRSAHTPDFPGSETFNGQIIHPQFWPDDLDYAGKRVVVIGSGATAMTLIPSMADKTESITMLQRSPTYVVSRPSRDWFANLLRAILPDTWAYAATRWRNVFLQQWVYRRTRRTPEKVKEFLLDKLRKELGKDMVEAHFTPHYNPWDQRLCLIPDEDLYKAINSGKASVVTDEIDRFTETGILLKSGQELPADIIVTATGLELAMMGETNIVVDDSPVELADTWTYKGIMYSGVPNLVTTFGYINASWTLRADLTAEYSCRLLNHMRDRNAVKAVPELRPEDADMQARDWIEDFSSNYMQRDMHRFPRQGDREPWLNPQDYRKDRKLFREAPIDDGALVFSALVEPKAEQEPLLRAAS